MVWEQHRLNFTMASQHGMELLTSSCNGVMQATGCDADITRGDKELHEQTCPYKQVPQLFSIPLCVPLGIQSCV